jgi:DNA mismatch endonuclease (patch repair protein)
MVRKLFCHANRHVCLFFRTDYHSIENFERPGSMDIYSREKRSDIMARVKATDSTPELTVRRILHSLGYRYRLHRKNLLGKPDIVLPKHKSIIFVHGCFWHHHKGCKKSKLPETNTDFWRKKILDNVARDKRTIRELGKTGWKVLVLWECQVRSSNLIETIKRFLEK